MPVVRLLAVVAVAGLLVAASREPSGHVVRQHSISKPYLASGMTIPFWDFIGNAIVSEEFVRLTPDRQAKKGGIWNSQPNELPEWEMTVQFAVHGQGKHLFGDGFALWYVAQPGVLGESPTYLAQPSPAANFYDVGSVFGSQDRFTGLGVFFDTYSNHKVHNHGHPYISALVNDGTVEYDHDSDGTHQEVAGCQSFFRNVDFDVFVRVIYRNGALTILTDAKDRNQWELCFTVPDVYLPSGYYFGASAATGDLADNHDIISFQISEPGPPTPEEDEESQQQQQGRRTFEVNHDPYEAHQQPFARHHAPPREHIPEPADESSGGILSTLLWLLILLAVLGAAGFVVKRKLFRQKESRYEF